MHSEQLYAQILGVTDPWKVVRVELDMPRKVEVFVELDRDGQVPCPECNEGCPRHDTRTRSWRHLDTCQLQTVLTAEVPRADCREHGIRQVSVPWATAGSRLTLMLEALVIDWLKVACIQDVSDGLGLSWGQVDGVMQRAVNRGLARREAKCPTKIGVDETSFKKRHKYVTVVSNLETGEVVHVGEGRGKQALEDFYEQFSDEKLAAIEAVAMDMHAPYISATQSKVPGGERKICFDKFHVAASLGAAVDKVRREENRELRREGDDRLVHTRYLWLSNPTKMSEERWQGFEHLRDSALRTARAWAIKEAAMGVWEQDAHPTLLHQYWKQAINWGRRSKLEPMKKVMKTLRDHLDGIIRAQRLRISNARAEGINSVIQMLKRRAKGFRNPRRFRRAIYFHLGNLDLYPMAV